MSTALPEPRQLRHYFVDEAGDAVLFSRKGEVLVGKRGCSRSFILGFLDVRDPDRLGCALDDLRARLLADSYFRGVPSMQPEARKTARCFHAKDDLPEVRREVFGLLRAFGLRFFGVVKDKQRVLEYVSHRNQLDSAYRYNPNELYDHMVRRLFKQHLHKGDGHEIYFARRGRSDRTAALREALEAARRRFSAQHGITTTAPISVVPCSPHESAGVQAADYFLWALQRLYERGEERYVAFLWPAFRLVIDVDDTREAGYGVYYTQKRPLTLATLREMPRDRGSAQS